MNQYETNAMLQKFVEAGYEAVSFEEKADIYVINTCTVTSISDKKSRMFLRQAKKNNENAIVVVVGCYVQVANEEVMHIPEVDLCLGTNEKKDIVNYVEDYLKKNKRKIDNIAYSFIDDVFENTEYGEFGSVTYTENTRAIVKVQDGCDRFCTYCMIPYARGRVRSRDPKFVVDEVQKIVKLGIKEVIITGIHVASYGKDFKNGYQLIDLLEEINKIDGLERIRLRINRTCINFRRVYSKAFKIR